MITTKLFELMGQPTTGKQQMLRGVIVSAQSHQSTQYEPRHDKTNKVTVCPAKTQISLGIRPV